MLTRVCRVFTVYGDVLVTVTTTELCIGTAEARSAVASETAPARGEPGHGYSGVVHGLEERRVAVPSYVATFETAQLSSACGCLVGFASRATATRAAVLQTVTENVAVSFVEAFGRDGADDGLDRNARHHHCWTCRAVDSIYRGDAHCHRDGLYLKWPLFDFGNVKGAEDIGRGSVRYGACAALRK